MVLSLSFVLYFKGNSGPGQHQIAHHRQKRHFGGPMRTPQNKTETQKKDEARPQPSPTVARVARHPLRSDLGLRSRPPAWKATVMRVLLRAMELMEAMEPQEPTVSAPSRASRCGRAVGNRSGCAPGQEAVATYGISQAWRSWICLLIGCASWLDVLGWMFLVGWSSWLEVGSFL